MDVHFMRAEALSAIRNFIKTDEAEANRLYSSNTNAWLDNFFVGLGIEQPFGVLNIAFDNFDLYYDPGKSKEENDVEASIKLYSAMIELKDSDAADERLWAGMCNKDLYGYVRDRWDYQTQGPKNVLSRFFFGQGVRRSQMTNTLARLWWVGRLTYDESENDPFVYTKYLQDQLIGTGRVPLFSNSFTSSPEILRGLLKALKQLEDEDYDLSDKKGKMVEAAKYLNILGGTVILDVMDKDEICEKVTAYMRVRLDKKKVLIAAGTSAQ